MRPTYSLTHKLAPSDVDDWLIKSGWATTGDGYYTHMDLEQTLELTWPEAIAYELFRKFTLDF